MPKGICILSDSWLKKDEYKLWLARSSTSQYARCTLCQKDLKLSFGVKCALEKHAKGKDHALRLKEAESANSSLSALYFTTLDTSSSQLNTAIPVASNVASISEVAVLDDFVHENIKIQSCEIRWALKVVNNHYSFRSCLGLNDLFKEMFPDSTIASKFQLSKTKCAYLVNFGIAPYIQEKVKIMILASPFFSVSFDESLNSVLEKQQMDVHIRFWSDESKKVETRYWNSQFQYRGNADELVHSLTTSLTPLPVEKMHHLSMDGPNVNWCVFTKMQSLREEAEQPVLEDLGSCSLHTVSNAFQCGVKAAEWGVEKVLQGMYKFLNKSPARRGDFVRVSSNEIFPKKFCPTRWVENEEVSQRALELWDDYVELIKEYLLLPPSKRPKDNKSFDNLVDAHKNPTINVKLHLFQDVASLLNGFLVQFQTDNPMIPFLSGEIENIIRRLMKFFITQPVRTEAKSAYLLSKVDVEKKENLVPVKMVKLTTGAADLLKKVPINLHDGVRKGFMTMLQTMIKKLQEKSPIKLKFVRVAAALSPMNMANLDADTNQKKFDLLVNIIYEHKRLTAKEADAAKEQYDNFLSGDVISHVNDFKNFNMKEDRLDEFLGAYIIGKKDYDDLWKVCQFIFTLSHGQSVVERGFNVNKDTLLVNMEEQTLVSLRTVYDEIRSCGGIESFDIKKNLLLSCKGASRKYKEYLEQQKEISGESEKASKRKVLSEEMVIVKRKKAEQEALVIDLRIDSDKFLKKANAAEDLEEMRKFVVKANSFKETLKQKEGVITDLNSALENLEKEMKTAEKK